VSIDRSLKLKGVLTRHRNVLTRAERVERLHEEMKWSEGTTVFGLPKVAHRKSHAGRKAKEAAAKTATPEAAAGAVPETPAAEPKPKGKAGS
jgi:small basic protein (TIGR04137 family)